MINFIINQIKYLLVYFKIKKNISLSIKSEIKSSKIILCELNFFSSYQIPMFYIINFFLKIKKFKVVGYYNYDVLKHSLSETSYIKFCRKYLAHFIIKKIYNHFGVKYFLYPKNQKNSNVIYYLKRIKKIKNKKKLLNLKLSNILIGDLLYDTYCKKYSEPTVNFNDNRFYDLCLEFIKLFYFWINFFKKNKEIETIIGCHLVYSYGIIIRIALHFKKKVFLASLDRIKKVNKNFPYEVHYKDFDSKYFKEIDYNDRKSIIDKGTKLLKNSLSGKFSFHNSITTLKKNSFNKKIQPSLISRSDNVKILISTHDFYDAPHAWGDHKLFADYYEWLVFLLKLSKKTKYDWYIKTHPDLVGKYGVAQRKSRLIIEKLLESYPNIKTLPPNYSNYRIIKAKINFVITCHGSVAYQYPFFGIPVITSSSCSPFNDYNFNINPKSRSDLRNLILKLDKIKNNIKINKKEIFNYYSVSYIFYNTVNWLFSYKKYIKFIHGWHRRDSVDLYYYWLSNFNDIKLTNVNNFLNKFFQSRASMTNIILNK